MDPQLSEAQCKKERRLWWWHRIATALLTAGVLFASLTFARAGHPFETDLSWFLRYCLVSLPALFLVHWATAVLFGRKSRPWQFRPDPADRKPRRSGSN